MHLAVLVFASALSAATFALDNGLMRTPPMGWLAWERFRCDIDCEHDPKNCISQNLFIDMADRLSEDGWRELGYVYVNIDDCWASMERDKQGRLQPDPKRFPGGILKLSRYLHDRGLKLGIYGDMGTHTCGGYPGTPLDKIKIDAQTFADWEVDMLKFDGCYSNATEQEQGYPLMSKALNATNRPIAYSCSWPAYQGGLPPQVNYTQLGEICNLWRNYGDIQDSWDSVLDIVDWFFDNQDVLMSAAGPGRWNDPDMLIIGDFGLSMDQSRSQMALWAIMAAPLFMSNDLRTISSGARSILQNKMAISINQDPMGIQGKRIVKEKSGIDVLWRPLSKNSSALVFFSRRTDMPYRYHTSLSKLNYTAGHYEVFDVFTGKTMVLTDSTDFVVSVNPTGVVMWYVSAPTKLGFHQFYKGSRVRGSAYDDHENAIPPVFL
ncbi:alpha-N-acetylgalactosaminidase-like isoform X1 [Thunnus albacares]|uniref:alpha-N-acetylgalactosaminidase-like isoform X1 n=2 Tax=Thunnus albacares TaxID=8236 RepID=UPI001CF69E37|nr:alpha-N-acetylgalactosaminidase-like isoform X1 [Thunnus albacares]XP_044185755.1 alpha-N-acetylgalactosaminidase-like isoform X1 [Thunnus albacares]XP_044185756.1 alpha-N-acetylgalactosaminidase-like isoform X1 [Thunnus albacares]